MKTLSKFVCMLLTVFPTINCFAQEKVIQIIEKDEKFVLMIDGVETYIKGVGGTNRLDIAAANGANAFRTWGGSIENAKKDLAMAKQLKMYVILSSAINYIIIFFSFVKNLYLCAQKNSVC